MLEDLMGERVVIDLKGGFVCLGVLQRIGEHFLEIRNADFHDLRDTETTRENYVVEAKMTGVKRNRRRVLLVRTEVVAVSRMEDIVDD